MRALLFVSLLTFLPGSFISLKKKKAKRNYTGEHLLTYFSARPQAFPTSSKANELHEAYFFEGMSSSPVHQNHKHIFFFFFAALPAEFASDLFITFFFPFQGLLELQ